MPILASQASGPRSGLAVLRRDDIGGFIDALLPHHIQLVLGTDVAVLAEQVALVPPSRPVLTLDLGGSVSVDAAIDLAIAQLARALRDLWPHPWFEDFQDFRDDALGNAHLPIRIAGLAKNLPELSHAWACKTVMQLVRGRSPRLDAPHALEWAQLALAISPRGLILFTSLQPDHVAHQVRAVEWLAQHAPVSIVVLARQRPDVPQIDRIAYGAREMASLSPPSSSASITTDAAGPCDASVILTLPPAPEGQPHPMSPIERKLHRLIQNDEELRPLFVFNKTVHVSLLVARLDLVWLDGRVAVELDGHEHRAPAKFRADRHRDYELMCAGYRVLRMTNDEVETDAPLAIEKIRRVARLVREEAR